MTTIPTRCQQCDRQLATQADYDTLGEGEGEHLCWSEWGSQCEPVDWRARALRVEAERDDARAQLVALLDAAAWALPWMLYVPHDHGDVAVGCDARRALERALDAAREFIESRAATERALRAEAERDEAAARVLEEAEKRSSAQRAASAARI